MCPLCSERTSRGSCSRCATKSTSTWTFSESKRCDPRSQKQRKGSFRRTRTVTGNEASRRARERRRGASLGRECGWPVIKPIQSSSWFPCRSALSRALASPVRRSRSYHRLATNHLIPTKGRRLSRQHSRHVAKWHARSLGGVTRLMSHGGRWR